MGQFVRPASAEVSWLVAHFFFNLQSAGIVSEDEGGMELPDVEAAHEVALDASVPDATQSSKARLGRCSR